MITVFLDPVSTWSRTGWSPETSIESIRSPVPCLVPLGECHPTFDRLFNQIEDARTTGKDETSGSCPPHSWLWVCARSNVRRTCASVVVTELPQIVRVVVVPVGFHTTEKRFRSRSGDSCCQTVSVSPRSLTHCPRAIRSGFVGSALSVCRTQSCGGYNRG